MITRMLGRDGAVSRKVSATSGDPVTVIVIGSGHVMGTLFGVIGSDQRKRLNLRDLQVIEIILIKQLLDEVRPTVEPLTGSFPESMI